MMLNYIGCRLIDRGKRVAFIVFKLLEEQGRYTEKQRQEICILTLLHDGGIYKTEEIDRLSSFEIEDIWEHSIYGKIDPDVVSMFSQHYDKIMAGMERGFKPC